MSRSHILSEPEPSESGSGHPSEPARNRRGRSTGPSSPEGKATSSKNSITHGCTSRTLIVANESEEDWNRVLESWLAEYQPDTDLFHSLVVQAAREHWFLLRNVRQYEQCEYSLHDEQGSPLTWSEEHNKKLDRFLRYKAAAERSFYRARNAVEQMRKTRAAETLTAAPARSRKSAASETPAQQTDPEPHPIDDLNAYFRNIKPIPTLRQYIDVRVENGITTTVIEPSNDKLLESAKTQNPAPEQVIRRLCFWNGFPPEYQWALNVGTFTSNVREQALTVPEWHATMELEQQAGTGHLLPSPGPSPEGL